MPGASPRRPVVACLAAVVVLAVATVVSPRPILAQEPTDQPGLPASPDGSPAPGSDANPALPPVAPPDNAASGLLPNNPPLPPHPSIPNVSLLPDSTPAPSASPLPLPLVPQTDSSLSPATPGAPGTTPATGVGSTTTNQNDAARRFQYAFRLSTGVTYDDNIFLTANGSSPGTSSLRRGFSRQDVYFVIDPSVSLGYGDILNRATNYVEFDYTADALIYVRNTDQDTVQHFFNLQGAYHFAQITLTFSQGIQLLDSTDLSNVSSTGLLGNTSTNGTAPNSQVNLDTSRRTRVDIFTTHLDANYAFSDKTSSDLDGYFSANDYETLISSESLSGDLFFNYSPTGKTTFGLGATLGYTIQDKPAPNEFYQELNLRLSYLATGKLTFAGTVGLETRETSGVGGVDLTPIFSLSINYSATDTTALALTANRSIETSAVLTGENYDSTSFSFTISQTLFQRLSARLSLGYTNSAYTSTGRGSSNVNRTDDYYFIQPGIDYTLRDNLSVGVFYIHRQDFSSLSNTGFTDNQIGARLSLSF